jgi:uncharacterized protein YjiS (DUF1127 family)
MPITRIIRPLPQYCCFFGAVARNANIAYIFNKYSICDSGNVENMPTMLQSSKTDIKCNTDDTLSGKVPPYFVDYLFNFSVMQKTHIRCASTPLARILDSAYLDIITLKHSAKPQTKRTAPMATFDTTRTTYGVATFTNRTFAFVADLSHSVSAWNDARVTNKALSNLSDRELADIGLARGDIDNVARSNFIR